MRKTGNFSPEQARGVGLTLIEAQRPFLQIKLEQYRSRLAESEKRKMFLAPELFQAWRTHYDNAAKVLVTEAILSGEPVDQKNILRLLLEKEAYKSSDGDKESESINEQHRALVEAMLKNALDVIENYNKGQMDRVFGSQPV